MTPANGPTPTACPTINPDPPHDRHQAQHDRFGSRGGRIALVAALQDRDLEERAASARALLALVAGQDVEPAEGSDGMGLRAAGSPLLAGLWSARPR